MANTGPTERLSPLPIAIRAAPWRGWLYTAVLIAGAGASMCGIVELPHFPLAVQLVLWAIPIALCCGATLLTYSRGLALAAGYFTEHSIIGRTHIPIEQIAGITLRNAPARYGVHRSIIFWDQHDHTINVIDVNYYSQNDLRRFISALLTEYPYIVAERELRQYLNLRQPTD